MEWKREKTGPAHLRTGALGAGLLDVARDRSLVPGIGAVPAHAGEQRDARCDIEEAGAKGPGRDIGSTSRTRAATDMKGRAREPGGGAAVAGTAPSISSPASPTPARQPHPPPAAGLAR